MSVPDAPVVDAVAAPSRRYWLVFLLRALVVAAVALAITFSADHSTKLGFLTFGTLAVLSGVVIDISSWRVLPRGIARSFFGVQGALSIVLGIVGFAISSASVPFLLFLVSAWAIFTGVLELYVGVRSRRLGVIQARDWIFAGGLTILLAIVTLVIPSGYSDRFTGPDGVARVLTASVISVGLFGAYAAILAVYLFIAALSLKWGTQRATTSPTPITEGSN